MRFLPFLLMTMLACPGCHTHAYLRDTTLQATSTLADLSYQQVLDNVARFTVCPSALPSIALVTQGTVTVADQKSYNGNAVYSPTLAFVQQMGCGFPILSLLFNPSVSRNLTENWSMTPVADMDKLRRVRCAFQLLVRGAPEMTDCDQCQGQIEEFFLADAERMECLVPKGWYCVGCTKEVPKAACYVGHCGDTYVWVNPEGMEGFSRFTMTIMALAGQAPTFPTRSVRKTYKSDGKLENTEITTTETDLDALQRMKDKKRCPEYPLQVPPGLPVNPGLFFVPRP